MRKIINILPGLISCIIVALIGMVFGRFFPSLGSGLFAILIGILVGNLKFGSKTILRPGIKFSESKLLYYSIILLGATLTFNSLFNIGITGISYILIQMAGTIAFVIWLGKKMSFGEDFRLLMASGNAVCGSSAIASTAPAINAKTPDMAVSITIVNLLGTVMMVLLPVITSTVFHNNVLPSSALIGGTLQSVGQVVASGSIIGEAVKDQAEIFKISRIIFLVLVVFVLKRIKMANQEAREATKEKFSMGSIVPWYVAGFLLLCVINSVFLFPTSITHPIKVFGNYLEIIALAGIGMSVNVKDLTQNGWKLSGYAGGIGLFQIIFALILIFILL
ncbi:putative sulfate exporter family transporter [Viridibacillus sp. YIM B01967]|uniref:Sulfate exporter family transporter n=1 Tax=Viridibacillus soli TaxID=2798301 RepID=A0ABS1HB43_9BACL|nr:putative sulfate exporter family transporter [Viridibacillus soli]MBK3496670.1 putative sulfate exporter family transporter [Viridibacillus soli]